MVGKRRVSEQQIAETGLQIGEGFFILSRHDLNVFLPIQQLSNICPKKLLFSTWGTPPPPTKVYAPDNNLIQIFN
jgi:hypothetical protein